MSARLRPAATISAVWPFVVSLAFTSAPFSTRREAVSTLPARAASISGDAPVAVSVVLELGAVEWERPGDDVAVAPLGVERRGGVLDRVAEGGLVVPQLAAVVVDRTVGMAPFPARLLRSSRSCSL